MIITLFKWMTNWWDIVVELMAGVIILLFSGFKVKHSYPVMWITEGQVQITKAYGGHASIL